MQIDDVTWKLIGNVLYNQDPERQETAKKLLKWAFADKDKRVTLKALYKADFKEYVRIDQMNDDEYQAYLKKRYNE